MAESPELIEDDEGLALVAGTMVLRADFGRMVDRVRPGALKHELLVRAARLRPRGDEVAPWAVDATAGLGEDALLLAAAGFRVTLVEREPKLSALLRDGLERAAGISGLSEVVARMELVEADSIDLMREMASAGYGTECSPDVIYLDPMFPMKRADARAKKKLQVIQMIERPCEDEAGLLEAALGLRPRKIVIKRPRKGPHLAGKKPSHSILGTTVRYDVIAC